FGESGSMLHEGEEEFSNKKPGAQIVLTWRPRASDPVAFVDYIVQATDGATFTGKVDVWQVRVPHEEVNFETDSAEIRPSERPKLEDSIQVIQREVAKYKKNKGTGVIKLFITGRTDTVGTPAYNLTLSRRRAQSIARWFRQSGLRIPILYDGVGESMLRVKTDDEVDELRNRGADYDLSLTEPRRSGKTRAAWKKVP
ncbi:MAG TPA: OmpA family protein, partial [Polyangiaceae bacterium]